jgi:hypothetical protein
MEVKVIGLVIAAFLLSVPFAFALSDVLEQDMERIYIEIDEAYFVDLMVKRADVDGSGSVNGLDIARLSAEMRKDNPSMEFDLNGDGEVDRKDFKYIQAFYGRSVN